MHQFPRVSGVSLALRAPTDLLVSQEQAVIAVALGLMVTLEQMDHLGHLVGLVSMA